jgi:hypothetical protein
MDMILMNQLLAPDQGPSSAVRGSRNSQRDVSKRVAVGPQRCAPTRRDAPPLATDRTPDPAVHFLPTV